MDGYTACLRKLRKVCTSVEKQIVKADDALTHSNGLISSLLNLLEQLAACEKVSFDTEPLAHFGDLQGRLRFKLTSAIESLLVKIHEDLNTIKEVASRFAEFRRSSFDVYNQHASKGNLSVAEAITAGPVCPSIASMLEWLQQLERMYAGLCEEKTEILEGITYNDLPQSQKELRRWKTQRNPLHLTAAMDQIRVFLADQKDA
ncbi:uncharacterized protein C1orf109 homolog [Nematostella vectensis]|uniref:uncharacterized protein C1orf109 homolog n=1 Tax=Nematostella vectensis TaxID=45351 RepID=UPI0020772E73|nr:uncharacterized protein C1orf109 homolog [Nematostella vectensis]